MKIFKYILFSCLLAASPTIVINAQFGIFKALGRGAKSAGKAATKGTAKGAKAVAKGASKRTTNSAAQRTAMIKRVSRSKVGMETTRHARFMANSCLVSGKALDRAALRVTEKLAAKGGAKAVENVTTEQLYRMVSKEVAREELKYMSKCAIVGAPYVAWRQTQRDDTSNTDDNGGSIKTERKQHTDLPQLPELNDAAVAAAGSIFGTNQIKIETLKSDVSANLRLKMAIEANPELLDAYNRCSNSPVRTDVTLLNYLSTRAKINDQMLPGTGGATLRLERTDQDNDIVKIFLNNRDKVAAAMISKGYVRTQSEGTAYYCMTFLPEIQDLRPISNCEIVTDKGHYYYKKGEKTIILEDGSTNQNRLAVAPTFYTDQQGRVVKFRHLFTKTDVCQETATAKMETLTMIALTTDARGSKTADAPAKGFAPHSIHPLWLGGRETWLNTIVLNKKAEKVWKKAEKNIQKLLKDKRIEAVWYEVVLTYDNAVTQTPSEVKVVKKWYHNKSGIQEEESLISSEG